MEERGGREGKNILCKKDLNPPSLVLKMEAEGPQAKECRGPTSQGMLGSSSSRKRQGDEFSPRTCRKDGSVGSFPC